MNYVAIAKEEQPEGAICTFCGSENDNADDCGWWYLHPQPDAEGFACIACADSGLLRQHQMRYGVGDR